jgi:hypothetical protein
MRGCIRSGGRWSTFFGIFFNSCSSTWLHGSGSYLPEPLSSSSPIMDSSKIPLLKNPTNIARPVTGTAKIPPSRSSSPGPSSKEYDNGPVKPLFEAPRPKVRSLRCTFVTCVPVISNALETSLSKHPVRRTISPTLQRGITRIKGFVLIRRLKSGSF